MTMQLQFSGPGTIASYKRLNYEYAHALAEFIDNSTHASMNRVSDLKANDPNYKLKVDITFEPRGGLDEKGIFEIQDNACGMTREVLEDALVIGKPPSIIGRSRYGMGMKTAAIWMGNRITIITKPLGETTEYEVVLDLAKISSGNFDLPFREKEKKDRKLSYTIIRVELLDQIPVRRAIGSIKEQLKSIYRADTRENTLSLLWNAQEIAWDNDAWSFLPSEDGTGFYKKDFEFEITRSDNVIKKVNGWVGVLLDGKRIRSGFSILTGNRVVVGYPMAWKPESIFGDYGSNDLVNQRLTGEIHLNSFDVTHTKDAIKWSLDEYDLVCSKLKEVCANYIHTAKNYKKRDYREEATDQQKQEALDDVKKEAESTQITDAIIAKGHIINPDLVDKATAAVAKKIADSKEPKFVVKYNNNLTVKVFIHRGEITASYLQISTNDPSAVSILVNETHPAFPDGKSMDALKAWYRMCLFDGIAEYLCQQMTGEIRPNSVREFKDNMYKAQVDIADTN